MRGCFFREGFAIRTATEEFIEACLWTDSQELLEEELGRISARSGEIDWERILLRGYRVAPEIYFRARNTYPDFDIPKEIGERIERQYVESLARNERIRCCSRELALTFRQEKINLVFLKGAALLDTLYKEDPALRFMNDLDVLVRKNDLARAGEILRREGYFRDSGHEDHGGKREKHLFHQLYFGNQISLELHWDIDRRNDLDLMDRFFRFAERSVILGEEIQVLSPAASLFLACTNSARDFFSVGLISNRRERSLYNYYACLSLFSEIKKMIVFYGPRMDWDAFLTFTTVSKWRFEVLELLRLAGRHAKAGIPGAILQRRAGGLFHITDTFLRRAFSLDDFGGLFFARQALFCFKRYLKRLVRYEDFRRTVSAQKRHESTEVVQNK